VLAAQSHIDEFDHGKGKLDVDLPIVMSASRTATGKLIIIATNHELIKMLQQQQQPMNGYWLQVATDMV
jgi:hypothetical protein